MSQTIRLGHPDPELSICVPTLNHNSSSIRWRKLINALFVNTVASYEVVIRDCQGELRGYTGPQNEAMAEGIGDILVAMNDDVIVSDGWDQPLIQALTCDGVWCATPDMTNSDGPQVFAPYLMAWNRGDWQEIGGMDSQFILWGSDIDLARRLVDAGHPPVRVKLPNPIQHTPGGTTGEYPAECSAMAAQDLERFKAKWGTEAEQEKVRLAVALGINTDPRVAYLR